MDCWNARLRYRPNFEQLIYTLTNYRERLPPSRPLEELYPDRDDFWEDEYI